MFFSAKAKEIFKNHKLILTKRNIKTSLLSMMNFLEDKKRMTDADLATWHFKTDRKEKLIN